LKEELAQRETDLERLISVQAELDGLEVAGDSQRLVFTLFGAAGVLISLGAMRGIPLLTLLGAVSAAGATVFLARDFRRSGRRRRLERAIADFDDRSLDGDSDSRAVGAFND